MSLGNNIKELRIKKQMSQEKIAEELGVSRQAVSKWETELSYPDTENLISLAKLFQVTVDELTHGISNAELTKDKKKSSFMYGKVLIISILGIFLILVGNFVMKDIISKRASDKTTLINPEMKEIDNATDQDDEKESKTDYLNSPESLEIQKVAQAFAKAYFSCDLEEVKLYLADVALAETYEENIYDNLEYLTLKWNPEDLATKTTISLQYQFQENGTDSATYLGMDMMKISDKWKITACYLEK